MIRHVIKVNEQSTTKWQTCYIGPVSVIGSDSLSLLLTHHSAFSCVAAANEEKCCVQTVLRRYCHIYGK